MRLPVVRFRVQCLLALLLYTAIGLAALRSSSYLCLRAVNTLVVAILFISILAATHCQGPSGHSGLGTRSSAGVTSFSFLVPGRVGPTFQTRQKHPEAKSYQICSPGTL